MNEIIDELQGEITKAMQTLEKVVESGKNLQQRLSRLSADPEFIESLEKLNPEEKERVVKMMSDMSKQGLFELSHTWTEQGPQTK